jgi:Ca-activated chloride channel family protein
VPFTQERLEKADNYIKTIDARGGTEILPAMLAALKMPQDAKRLRIIIFLTDGSVGNETDVLMGVKKTLGNARIYTFGIGSAVNRFLLDKMAEIGRGFVEYLLPAQNIEETMRRFQNKISFPILTDLSLRWEGVQVVDVYPPRTPDLFLEEPVAVVGRFLKSGVGKLLLEGQESGKKVTMEVPLDLPEAEQSNLALPLIWARERIGHLSSQEMEEPFKKTYYRDEIISLAIQYHLASQYTSFVAVEKQTKPDGKDKSEEKCVPIRIPTEIPEGMDYNAFIGLGGVGRNPNPNITACGSAPAGGFINFCASMMPSPSPKASGYSGKKSRASTPPPDDDERYACSYSIVSSKSLDHSYESDVSSNAEPLEQDVPENAVELSFNYLTRVQNADGSWGEKENKIFLTSMALVGFAHCGHTDKKGNYTIYLRRASSFLQKETIVTEEESMSYFWAMATLLIQGDGPNRKIIEGLWGKMSTMTPQKEMLKLLHIHCNLAAKKLGLEQNFTPPTWEGEHKTNTWKEFFATVLGATLPDNPKLQAFQTVLGRKMALSGEKEGCVKLPCGEIAATIGAAIVLGIG